MHRGDISLPGLMSVRFTFGSTFNEVSLELQLSEVSAKYRSNDKIVFKALIKLGMNSANALEEVLGVMRDISFYAPTMEWRRAYSFTRRHTSVCPSATLIELLMSLQCLLQFSRSWF